MSDPDLQPFRVYGNSLLLLEGYYLIPIAGTAYTYFVCVNVNALLAVSAGLAMALLFSFPFLGALLWAVLRVTAHMTGFHAFFSGALYSLV